MKFFNLDALKHNLTELHIHLSIQSFAMGMIGVFIPVFLITLGLSLKNIFFYYFITGSSALFFSFLSAYIAKAGFKRVMLFRPLSLIVFFAWMYLLNFFPQSVWLLAVYHGFFSSIYWVIFHYFFAKKAEEDNVEGQVGLLFALPKIFDFFAPLIGALIISYFSFTALFVIVSIILLISIIPLVYLKDHKFDFKIDFKRLFDASILKYVLGFIAENIDYNVVYIILPIFIYTTFNQPVELGFFSTIIGISGFLTPLLISNFCRGKSSLFIKMGAVLEAVFFSFIFLLHTQLEFFLFGFIIGTFTTFWTVPFYSRMYKHAKNTNTLEFMIVRKAVMHAVDVIFFITLFFITDFSLPFILNILSKALFFFF